MLKGYGCVLERDLASVAQDLAFCCTFYSQLHAAAAAKLLQSCPTLCDSTDGSPPGSPVPGILQARTLEWVAISFSNAWQWKVKVKLLSCVWLLATPWAAAYPAPLSMGFARQEYWSGLPLPSLQEFPRAVVRKEHRLGGLEQQEFLLWLGFPSGSAVKNPPVNEGDPRSIPRSGRSPGGGNVNPL